MTNLKIKTRTFVSLFLTIVFTLLICSCGNTNKSASNQQSEVVKKDSAKIILKDELPPLKTCSSDLGVLKMDVNGNSVGSKTEMTELRKLLKNKECDVIEIIYEWDSETYENMPKKIVYNRRDGTLKDIYTKTNVIEDYSGVDEAGLKKFLDKGEKNFYSLSDYTDAKYDFNNREMKKKTVGNQPSQSELDGSVSIVKDYIKANSKDASSIEFLEWSKVSSFDVYWIVRCKFKGTNSFGAVVTENKWFYMQKDKVVKTKDIIE
jgi:hypothetical protein